MSFRVDVRISPTQWAFSGQIDPIRSIRGIEGRQSRLLNRIGGAVPNRGLFPVTGVCQSGVPHASGAVRDGFLRGYPLYRLTNASLRPGACSELCYIELPSPDTTNESAFLRLSDRISPTLSEFRDWLPEIHPFQQVASMPAYPTCGAQAHFFWEDPVGNRTG